MAVFIRLELILDGLVAKEIFRIIRKLPEVTCTIQRTLSCKHRETVITSNDFADSLSYNTMLLFFPEESYVKIQKAILPQLNACKAQVYESVCQNPNWLNY